MADVETKYLDEAEIQRQLKSSLECNLENISKENELSGEEIEFILIYYQDKVMEYFFIKLKIELPDTVFCLAFQFAKKFYLKESLYRFHPFFICYLSIFLACKIENVVFSVNHFMELLPPYYKGLKNQFIENEIVFLEKINYNLNVGCVFRALNGLTLHYKVFMENQIDAETPSYTEKIKRKSKVDKSLNNEKTKRAKFDNNDEEKNNDIMKKCRKTAYFVITTNLVLSYPASQLSAAILASVVGIDVVTNAVKDYTKLDDSNGTKLFNDLTKISDIIQSKNKIYKENVLDCIKKFEDNVKSLGVEANIIGLSS